MSQESNAREIRSTYTVYLFDALAQGRGLCVRCTYSATNKEHKRLRRSENKDVERGSPALDRDALSGPHVGVDVDCRRVALCLRLGFSAIKRAF